MDFFFRTATKKRPGTVDGRNPAPVEVGSLSHYLQVFLHPRWLFGIPSINSIKNYSRFVNICEDFTGKFNLGYEFRGFSLTQESVFSKFCLNGMVVSSMRP